MHRIPRSRHTLPENDSIPPWARLVLYVVAILAPFAALITGRLTGEQTVAAVVALFGAIGPAVAVVYERKQTDTAGQYYRAGYAEAVHEHVVGNPQAADEAGGPRPAETENAGSHIPTNDQG